MLTTQFLNHLDKTVRTSFKQFSELAIKQSFFNQIFKIVDTTEYVEGFTGREGIDDVDYVDEDDDFKEQNEFEGHKTFGESREFAGKVTLTKKMRIRAKDDTTQIMKIANDRVNLQVISARRFVEQQTHSMLNNAFTTQLAPDGNPFIGQHEWKNPQDASYNFNNNPTSNAKIGLGTLRVIKEYAGDLKDATGTPMEHDFTTFIVKKGGAAFDSLMKITDPNNNYETTSIGTVNIHKGSKMTIIETPFMTNGNAWFARSDNMIEGINSLQARFVERFSLDERQTRENLTYVYPGIGSFKFGCFSMPSDWVGSDGSNAAITS